MNNHQAEKRGEYLRKQRVLYEHGYYDQFPDLKQKMQAAFGDLYPIKKAKYQTIGTETQSEIYNQFFNEPGTLLDIGGNAGNLLHYGNPNIKKYTCIDVSKKAVTMGKLMYPDANFIHHDRLNYMYNPTGLPDADFPEVESHDFVFIHSVFPCTDFNDMLYTLSNSLKVAKTRIVFSVFSNKNTTMLETFYNRFCEREIQRPDLWPNKTSDFRRWVKLNNHIFYLINNDLEFFDESTIRLTEPCLSVMAVYNIDWLKNFLERHFQINITVQDPCAIDSNFTILVIERR